MPGHITEQGTHFKRKAPACAKSARTENFCWQFQIVYSFISQTSGIGTLHRLRGMKNRKICVICAWFFFALNLKFLGVHGVPLGGLLGGERQAQRRSFVIQAGGEHDGARPVWFL